MTGAHQYAAVTRNERKHMPRADDIPAVPCRVDRHRDCVRPVVCGDPGGDAFARFNGNRKRSLMARLIGRRHVLQFKLVSPL